MCLFLHPSLSSHGPKCTQYGIYARDSGTLEVIDFRPSIRLWRLVYFSRYISSQRLYVDNWIWICGEFSFSIQIYFAVFSYDQRWLVGGWLVVIPWCLPKVPSTDIYIVFLDLIYIGTGIWLEDNLTTGPIWHQECNFFEYFIAVYNNATKGLDWNELSWDKLGKNPK